MPAKDKIPAGFTFVEGRSADTARELLEAAEAAGVAGQVYTTSFGYLVPDAALDDKAKAKSEEESDAAAEAEAAAAAEAEAAAAAEAEAKAAADAEKAAEGAKQYDPTGAKVEEVLEYLAGADEEERTRVIAAEAAGKNRVTITEYTAEGAQ